MNATGAFGALRSSLFAVYGQTATWGVTGSPEVTVCLMPDWREADANGIGIERIEPVGYVTTADAATYGVTNGTVFSVGSDSYRILASAADDMGITKLALTRHMDSMPRAAAAVVDVSVTDTFSGATA